MSYRPGTTTRVREAPNVNAYPSQSPEGIFVDGVWGPYKDPIIQGWWMNEGGQSSTGQVSRDRLGTAEKLTARYSL